MREIGRLVLVLGLICSISAGALAWARGSLASRIEKQEDFYVRGPALERLFEKPAQELLGNKVRLQLPEAEYTVFYTREGQDVGGLAIEAAGHGGYSGDIVIMIGVDRAASRMLGVEIVTHGETPGVGAQVLREDFRAQWQGMDAASEAALRSGGGQIDAITGATFSSRAMIDGTNQITAVIREHEDEILTLIGEAEAQRKKETQ